MTDEPESGPLSHFEDEGPRTWIVTLRARSAARIKSDGVVNIVASANSTVPVAGVKIRNLRFNRPDGGSWIAGIIAEAAGTAKGSLEAVGWLANLAGPFLQVVALASNAAVEQEYDILAYAPPTAALPGHFHYQRPCVPDQPAARTRSVAKEDLGLLLELLGAHVSEHRLHRSMAQFMLALQFVEPQNWMLAAEHLFIAVENLARVVLRRLYLEANLAESGKSKHKLAVAAGFEPIDASREHLNQFDSYVRLHHIFDDDAECYRSLKSASDHFEHGSRDFGVVRDAAAASAADAFGYIRRAILREVGLPPDNALLGEVFDFPLGSWHPRLEVFGDYAHPGVETSVRLDPQHFCDAWPAFAGINIVGFIDEIRDDDESGERNLRFKMEGNGDSFIDGQSASVRGTTWVVPTIRAHEVNENESTMEIRIKKAGEDDWRLHSEDQ